MKKTTAVTSIAPVIYRYTQPLVEGLLTNRYKRFLADVELNNMSLLSSLQTPSTVVHCPNTGSMLGLKPEPHAPRKCVCVDNVTGKLNSKRKYQYTLEMIQDRGDTWVGIHSAFANKLVKEAILNDFIEEIGTNYTSLNCEVNVLNGSKIDFEIVWDCNKSEITTSSSKRKRVNCDIDKDGAVYKSYQNAPPSRRMLLEVKSVTLAEASCTTNQLRAVFPDCISERAQKHIKCLMDYVLNEKAKGTSNEAAILFLVQRDDCSSFSASQYDLEYRKLLSQAAKVGVKILCYHCKLDPRGGTVSLLGKLPFIDTYSNAT